MKYIALLLFAFSYSVVAFAQTYPPEKQHKIDSLKAVLDVETNEIEIIKTLNNYDALIYSTDMELDIKLLSEIIERCEKKLQDSLNAEDLKFYTDYYTASLSNAGMAFLRKAQYQKALEVSFKSLNFLSKDSSNIIPPTIYLSIGSIYMHLQNDELALKYFNKVLELEESISNEVIAAALHNKGIIYSGQEKTEEALQLYFKSLEFKNLNEPDNSVGNTYYEIAKLYTFLEQLDSGLQFCSKSMAVFLITKNPWGIINPQNLKARILYEQGKYASAIRLLKEVLNSPVAIQNVIYQRDARELLYACYSEIGEYKKAAEEQLAYRQIKDSLLNDDIKSIGMQKDIEFEYEKAALQDSLLNEKKMALLTQELSQQIEKERYNTFLTILFILGLTSITVLFVVAYRQKRKSNLLLSDQYALKEEILKNKELFMKEIHHRVKNNMQMVSSVLQLKSSESKNKEVKRELLDSQSRILSMSLAHKNLYEHNNYESIELKGYLLEIINTVIDSETANDNIALSLLSEQVYIHVDQSQAIGFIIHELALNSVKYAWEKNDVKQITIELVQKNGQLKVIYADNGKGMPDVFSIETANSMGLKLVRSFVKRQLKGTIQFYSHNGTKVEIDFIPERKILSENKAS